MSEISSFFDEQAVRRKQTWFFLLLGFIWTAFLGYLAVFVNIEFLNLIEVSDLRSIQATKYYFYGAAVSVLIWAVVTTLLMFYSPSIFPKLVGSKNADDRAKLRLKRCLEEMALASGQSFQKIKCYIMNSPALNAFACGRSIDKGSIVITKGLVETLNDEEMQAVIAHELAHLKNGDSMYVGNAIAFVWVVIGCGMAAYGLVTIALALICGIFVLIMKLFEDDAVGCVISLISFILFIYALIHLGLYILLMGTVLLIVSIAIKIASSSVSKAREYLADACAAQWTRNPVALASALQKISGNSRIDRFSGILISPLWLENPYVEDKDKIGLTSRLYRFLLKTHPSIESRLDRLRAMAGSIVHTEARFLREFRISPWKRAINYVGIFLLTIMTILMAWLLIRAYFPLSVGIAKTSNVSQQKENQRGTLIGFINRPLVNVRESPGLDSRIINRLSQNTPVTILGEREEWYLVEWIEHGQVKRGWVANRLITLKEAQIK